MDVLGQFYQVHLSDVEGEGDSVVVVERVLAGLLGRKMLLDVGGVILVKSHFYGLF